MTRSPALGKHPNDWSTTIDHRNRRRARHRLLVALTILLLGLPAAASAATGQGGADPELAQKIDSRQPVASGRAVLDEGHVDLGPRFVDGRWTILVHDDSTRGQANAKSVWRRTEETVLRVTDEALLTVPDDPAYGFLPAEPGAEVFVVPQTQDPEVVWIGWNTQDPEVMNRIDRGVTMSLEGVDGPGGLSVYLQSGDFGKPEPLWDSRRDQDSIWVDVNTHTHANWVFTAPGVYLVRMTISADLVDGSTVTDTRDLRFAVGSDTDPEGALGASWSGPETGTASEPNGTGDAPEGNQDSGPGALPIVVAALAVLLGGVAAVVLARSRRAKRRAREGGAGARSDHDESGAS